MTRRTEVRLPRAVARAVRVHARHEAPRECCGFLIGTPDAVQYCLPMPNVAAGTARYRIDPRAHLELRRLLRRVTPPLEIVGVYHSHPRSRAVPSPRDCAESFYPDWIHLIAGPVAGRLPLRAFRLSPAVIPLQIRLI